MPDTPTAVTTILLIGRNQWVVDAARRELSGPGLRVLGATTAAELDAVLATEPVDHAFVGPGLPLDQRLAHIEQVCTRSGATSVHLKDATTGPEGALDFVRGVLAGLDRSP